MSAPLCLILLVDLIFLLLVKHIVGAHVRCKLVILLHTHAILLLDLLLTITHLTHVCWHLLSHLVLHRWLIHLKLNVNDWLICHIHWHLHTAMIHLI